MTKEEKTEVFDFFINKYEIVEDKDDELKIDIKENQKIIK